MNDTPGNRPRVLIVDDEPAIRDLLAMMLSDACTCVTSESAEIALEEFAKAKFDLVISDINLGGMSGVEMVPCLQEISPDTVVMMISGAQSVDAAIDAMRVGVFDYLRKPFDHDHVLAAVERALRHREALLAKQRHEVELSTLIEQQTAELHHLAHHDTLTDLPNETMFEDRVRQVLATHGLDNKTAIMLIAISNLRRVRESIGLAAASQILREASERLQNIMNEEMIARYEGDKFAVLISSTDQEKIVDAAVRAFHALKPAFVVDTKEIHALVHIGISVFPADGTDCDTLIRNAGAALSRAETEGTDYQFYAAEMNARATRQLALENNLRRALDRNEFAVFYQPKVDVATDRIVGMEALLRWNNEELGPVSPDVFIPVAESTDIIISLGEWVLRTACFQARSWQKEGFPLNLAVNLSARQFQDRDLSKRIWNILQESSLDPHSLNLEVTESSLVENPDAAIEILSQLQKLGVSISIDDFGTGHSSLGYLRSLPVDVLKIDKSFISSITTEPDDATLVKAMITLAHDLRLRVVAEGVETNEQLQALNDLGCDEWQGFLRSRPVPADEFVRQLRMTA